MVVAGRMTLPFSEPVTDGATGRSGDSGFGRQPFGRCAATLCGRWHEENGGDPLGHGAIDLLDIR
jgi:hypothetical protein